ncbi:VCBS repeat-containing protein [Streptomyces sp. NPDC051940]|uniref:FG-GAP repeat domain-containing protein n=1 Tax=Streptomyces sp. NPDC051940 TaxID=3155675 RepID=UPI00341A9A3B
MNRKTATRLIIAPVLASLALTSLAVQNAFASTQGGTIDRTEVMSRAKNWYDRDIQYSQTSTATDPEGDHTYCRDCSGFVSMAWHLSADGMGALTTNSLPSVTSTLSNKRDLLPGDALNNITDGHVVLFAKWINKSEGTFNFYQEANSTMDMSYGQADVDGGNIAGLPAANYTALRYDKIGTDAPPVVTGKGDHDYNRDSDDDLLAVNASSGYLSFYAGDGTAGFKSTTQVGPGWGVMDKVAGADFDNDGDGDLVATKTTGELLLYKGTGAGSFQSPSQIGNGWGNVTKLAAGDFTADGKADVIAVNKTDDNLYLYTGTGSGVSNGTQIGNGWGNIAEVAAGDFTGDRRADLIAITTTGDLYLYAGTSTGVANGIKLGSGFGNMTDITVADMNSDGKADVVVAAGTTGELYYYASTGSAVHNGIVIGASGWDGVSHLI